MEANVDLLEKPIHSQHEHWKDSLIQDYYITHYNRISSKELDKEFRKDIKALADTLSKLSTPKRKMLIDVISSYISFYVDQKVEKEIDSSLMKILKF